MSPTPPIIPPVPQKSMHTPFGKAAVMLRLITNEQLNSALLVQATNDPHQMLGEILQSQGLLSAQQVEMILARQATKAMICPTCKHKFQIVMYQKGRTYPCRHCPEPVGLIEDVTFKPTKKTKTDFMGLTQEYKMASVASNKLDFATDEPVSTENILEHAGVHPLILKDYSKRPKAYRRPNYILWVASILILGGLAFFATQYISDKDQQTSTEQPKPTPVNTSELEAQAKQKELQEKIEKVLKHPVDMSNQESIETKLALCKDCMATVPPDYETKIPQEIQRLETALQRVTEQKKADKYLIEAQDNLSKGLWRNAETSLQLASQKQDLFDANLQKELQNFRTKLEQESVAAWKKELAKLEELNQKCLYSEMLQILDQNKHNRIEKIQAEAQLYVEKIQQEQDELNWIYISMPYWSKIYPLLQQHNYDGAKKILETAVASSPQYKTRWQEWQKQVQAMQNYWIPLEKTITQMQSRKNKITWVLNDGSKVTGTIIKLYTNKDMVYIQLANGSKNLALSQISNKQVVSIYPPPDNATFLALAVPWKGVQGLEEWIPSDLSSSIGKQWTILLAADIDVSIRTWNQARLQVGIEIFFKQQPTPTWQILNLYLARLFWDTAQQPNPKITKKQQRAFMQILQEKFSHTEFATKASEWLQKN